MNPSTATTRNISDEATSVLHDGIRAELINEAMEWVGDFRTPVWMALISTANRMGVVLMKEDLYAAMAERRDAAGKPPMCPNCGNARQVWRNQISGKWTCHRAHCDTQIE